ncbi:MAG TPA: 50S ribosomal protein L11 methyltransferase [Streptosporangiaceae bacterium]
MTPAAPGSARAAGAAAFVRANGTLRQVPLVPEIRLHLADDAFRVWEASEHDWDGRGEAGPGEMPPPFWAFAWPGGQALARHILDHGDLVAGRSVLDLGSGSGVTAIAAALAGAASVLASEIDPLAVAAIGLNAAANDVSVDVTGDVLDGAGEDATVVLAADVWYERTLAERTFGLLRRARARGACVLAGDIGRAFLPRLALRELAACDVPVLAGLEDAAVKRVQILTLL